MAPIGRQILLPVAIGMSLCGLSAYLLYLFIKRDENEDYNPKTSRQSVLEIVVPKEMVPALIGRAGSNIKSIQEKAGCRINFKDDHPDNEDRVCVIRGENDGIRMAELLILDFISNLALIQTEEMWVPQTACGRIIGRCGENIQKLMRSSNARINVDNPGASSTSERKVVIKGTPEQIAVAKSLIEANVLEDEELRRNLSNRQPRGKAPAKPTPIVKPQASTEPDVLPVQREKLAESGQIDGQIEVYVSAVEDPGKFWVQIVGPKATELDQLVEQMTEYYGKDENLSLHKLEQVDVGEIVAAAFMYDGKWYRAEVTAVKEDPMDINNTLLDLYYVDYGDTGIVKRNDVYELRTDFLRLRFQAIECFLAQVEPSDGEWTNDATDLFEGLTQVAQWKKLCSKIVCYKERDASNSNGRARREGSPIPGVHLYDNNKDDDINIAEELVRSGHAVPEKKMSSSASSISGRSDRVTLSEGRASPPNKWGVPKNKTPQTIDARFLVDSMDESNSNSDSSSNTERTLYKGVPTMTPNPNVHLSYDIPAKAARESSASSGTDEGAFSTPLNGNMPMERASQDGRENGNLESAGDHVRRPGGSKTTDEATAVVDNKHDTHSLLQNERMGGGDFTPIKSSKVSPKQGDI